MKYAILKRLNKYIVSFSSDDDECKSIPYHKRNGDYCDENGKLLIFDSVEDAETAINEIIENGHWMDYNKIVKLIEHKYI